MMPAVVNNIDDINELLYHDNLNSIKSLVTEVYDDDQFRDKILHHSL